jgi:uncharacterized protein YecE (DUF72 family)
VDGVFYPTWIPKDFAIILNCFNMGEMDSTFYDRFHSQMTKDRFIGMVRATPEIFQFSIKVPETISHVKELDVKK